MPGSAVSDLAGRVLAGRYLLHGAIGTGASGRVYVAEDTRLRRRVAVKVLHAALADDAAFLRRFRAEAQLAASLHHQHIVTVHDWGEDEVPFMVLELLEGGSLRAMLDDGTRLSVAQAARVGRDVASALEYAHSRGVLHRDIKPANLLFDEHGIVRVADFGLARALAEASWTEPAGAVFGTARYASPEQASGVQLDARSDVYSLGLVLVEAVTGSLPFTADTTLGLLTARTMQPVSAPEEMGPLAPVIERAGTIDAADRYPDAATMRAALSDAAESLPPPAPLQLAGMADRVDPHPTRAVPAKPAKEPTKPVPAVTKPPPRLFDQDTAEIVVEPEPAPTIEVVPPRKLVPGQRRLVPFVVGFVVLVVVVIATAAFAHVSGATPIPVHSYVGLSVQNATNAAHQDGLTSVGTRSRAAPDPPGTVVDQSPKPGAFSSSRRVTLIVSTGPPNVNVPSVVGQRWSDVEKQFKKDGWLYSTQFPYNETVAKGFIVNVQPDPGKSVSPDTPLVVIVSAGHAPVKVPDVSGLKYSDAKQALEALHFVVPAEVDDFDSTVPRGKVIRTDPAHDTQQPYGSTVTIHVSKGPELIAVPDLKGDTLSQAAAALHKVGLNVGTTEGWQSDRDTVVGQTPKRNQKVPRGGEVDLRFAGPSIICSILGTC
jgi:beta-lactam-binding protein with PASTA domain/tRNA A-37 threonylcarbamoyl transferase component Bud32